MIAQFRKASGQPFDFDGYKKAHKEEWEKLIGPHKEKWAEINKNKAGKEVLAERIQQQSKENQEILNQIKEKVNPLFPRVKELEVPTTLEGWVALYKELGFDPSETGMYQIVNPEHGYITYYIKDN